MAAHRRRFRIIRPKLQLRLILSFVGISALALLLQYVLFVRVAVEIASRRADAGVAPLEDIGVELFTVFCVSFFVMLPLTVFVGVLVTHRFAGPVYRFEKYLGEVIAGAKPADCRLRQGDDLQELCALINRATEPLRRDGTATRTESPGPSASATAAPRAPLPEHARNEHEPSA
jgi:hypothetical protein